MRNFILYGSPQNKGSATLLHKIAKREAFEGSLLFQPFRRNDTHSNSTSSSLTAYDYIDHFVTGLQKELRERHPYLLETINSFQPVVETIMLTGSTLSKVRLIQLYFVHVPIEIFLG